MTTTIELCRTNFVQNHAKHFIALHMSQAEGNNKSNFFFLAIVFRSADGMDLA
jgi:hypothetical protein